MWYRSDPIPDTIKKNLLPVQYQANSFKERKFKLVDFSKNFRLYCFFSEFKLTVDS